MRAIVGLLLVALGAANRRPPPGARAPGPGSGRVNLPRAPGRSRRVAEMFTPVDGRAHTLVARHGATEQSVRRPWAGSRGCSSVFRVGSTGVTRWLVRSG